MTRNYQTASWWLCLAVAAALVVGLSGCATPAMKGTPFYTGEYSTRKGPAEDRVNLWPLLYYRDPALSVLWPLAELTDDHVAVRPLFSVYGLDREKKVTNVLCPLATFDQNTGRNRIFSVSWRKGRASVFPLYWHSHAADGSRVNDMLLPLWIHNRDRQGTSTHVLPPVFHYLNTERKKGGHLWPLAGRYSGVEGTYAFAAWPLAHRWTQKDGDRGHMVLPLYARARGKEWERFFSLPFSRGSNVTGGSWHCVPPLYHRESGPEGSHFMTPLLGWGTNSVDGTKWGYALPFTVSTDGIDGGGVYTPLYGTWQNGERTGWGIWPLLSWGSEEGDAAESWWLGALGHSTRDGEDYSRYVAPLFYQSKDGADSTFISLPWMQHRTAESEWSCLPPVFYRGTNTGGRTLLTPLFASGESRADDAAWHTVPPLYYKRDAGDESLFATLLGGWRSDDSGRTLFVPPLLSWVDTREEGGEVWALAPLIHAEWDGEDRKHHVLPLYYCDSEMGMLLSPLLSRWEAGEDRVTAVPPLLSWKIDGEDRSDLWMAGPLAHLSWGEKADTRHVLPLFYQNRATDTFISAAYATWKGGDTRYRAVPPLLSWSEKSKARRELNVALGLYRHENNTALGDRQSHLFPFYAYDNNEHFYTPLFGWKKDSRDGFTYPLTPLFGFRQGRDDGWWLFPFYSHRRNDEAERRYDRFLWGNYSRTGAQRRSGLFPFYGYNNRTLDGGEPQDAANGTYGPSLWALPACWYRNRTYVNTVPERLRKEGADGKRIDHVRSHGFFPLWSHRSSRTEGRSHEQSKTSVLLALFDHKHEVRPAREPAGEPSDYTLSRVLWRLWHYEKLNGDVSVDVFPGITYDSRPDEAFRSVSFLWRLFRYETSATGKKLDLLFLPLMRRDDERKSEDAT